MPPDIKVIKLKIRRGTDADRKLVKLDQGELGYTTDTQRVFVGDGVTFGGFVVGNKIYTPDVNTTYNSLTGINAQVGDVVPLSGVSYQLTSTDYTQLSSWTLFSPKLNTTYLKYSGNQVGALTLVPASIDSTILNTTSLSSATINFDSNKINVNYDTSIFSGVTSLAIKNNGLSAVHISPSTLGKGLSGGSGSKIAVDVDGVTLGFIGNKLQVISTPVTALRLENFGFGFSVSYPGGNNVLINAQIGGADNENFTVDSNILYLNAPPLSSRPSGTNELPYIVSQDGYITDIQSSIYDFLSCNNSSPSMSAYNGVADQITNGYTGNNPRTIITALSTNGISNINLSLSSAGFIVFRGQEQVRSRVGIPDSFAIPIFSLPSNIP